MSKPIPYSSGKADTASIAQSLSSKSAKPGSSKTSKAPLTALSKAPSPNFQPPPGTAFLFRIDQLAPNWDELVAQFTEHGYWNPPFYYNAYQRAQGSLFRWKDGLVTPVAAGTTLGQQYSCATVFTQSPWTGHFLVAEFDAQTRNVSQHGGWHTLGFNHVPHPTEDSEYSELDLDNTCSEHHLVAPVNSGTPSWVNDLFTAQYKYNAQTDANPPQESAGLIGKLSLLLALVAFSRPPAHIASVLMNHVRAGRWEPLGTTEHGRIKYRGMVVTIWLDPASNTTAQVLRAIERGSYGAFFR
ncbi:hypothetical protein MMC30_003991 [Trapelia coarctata]|nr:hypothetical protein [Trapelia coarctata]